MWGAGCCATVRRPSVIWGSLRYVTLILLYSGNTQVFVGKLYFKIRIHGGLLEWIVLLTYSVTAQ